MNGIHDMGGDDGFGAVVVEAAEPVFHHAWERRVFGTVAAVSALRLGGGTDAFRFAIERMAPEHYLRAPYYERWLTALATQLVARGVLTHDELTTAAGGPFPLAQPLPEASHAAPASEDPGARFALGDTVRVRNRHPREHTRCPRYVRGRLGTIVRCDGAFDLPDLAARGERRPEPAYGVRFTARELWGDDVAPHDLIHVDLWQSYLEPA